MNEPRFLSIETLKKMPHFSQDFAICDIRSPQEFAREHIPSSINIPLENIPSYDFSKLKEKNVLFLCRSGLRTRNAVHLIRQKNISHAACLEGGIEKWKSSGLPVTKNNNIPIDIMRQVQIIAGSMILLGLMGYAFLSPAFLALPLIVGLGQMLAGTTGFCGMAKILSRLPLNQIPASSCSQKKTEE